MTADQKAKALTVTITSIWAAWSDENEDARDDALRIAVEAVRAIDLHQVCGTIASPLNYFAKAYLDEYNPEDLTYDEMMNSLAISLSL